MEYMFMIYSNMIISRMAFRLKAQRVLFDQNKQTTELLTTEIESMDVKILWV